MMRFAMTAASFLVSIATLASGAAAAPQVMALLPTDGAKPLVCAKGVCRAEFTVMCLQVERRAPDTGVPYELMPGHDVTVVLSRADGETRRLGADVARLSVTSLRTHVSVEIKLPQGLRDSAQATAIAIAIPKTAFLIPRPVAGDSNPISIAEVRGVVGQHLRIAAQFDRDVAAGLAAVQLLSELVNALPTAPGTTPADERRIMDKLFARVLATDDRPQRTALESVRQSFERCQYKPVRRDFVTAQACLEVEHDGLMTGINMVYWDRTQGG